MDAAGKDARMEKGCSLEWGLQCDERLVQRVATQHAGWVQALAFSRTGFSLVTGSSDRTLRIIEPESRYLKSRLDFAHEVYAVAVSPVEDRLAAACADGSVYVYDTVVVDTAAEEEGKQGAGAGAPSEQGERRADGDRAAGRGDVDGKAAAAGPAEDAPQSRQRLEVRQRYVIAAHENQPALSLAFSRDGKYLVSGSVGCNIYKHVVESGELAGVFSGHQGYVYALALSPDGATLASGSGDETVKLWNFDDHTCVRTFTEHIGWVWAVDFHPTDGTLASGSNDRTVCVWDYRSGALRRKIEVRDRVYSLAFSPSTGNFLVCGSDGETSLRVYDVQKDYAAHRKFDGEQTGRVFAVAMSKADGVFAAGSECGNVVLYSARDEAAPGPLPKSKQGQRVGAERKGAAKKSKGGGGGGGNKKTDGPSTRATAAAAGERAAASGEDARGNGGGGRRRGVCAKMCGCFGGQ